MLDFLFIGSVAPVALLLWYIYRKDSIKEPRYMLFRAFCLGAVATLPILIAELFFDVIFSTDAEEVGSGLVLLISVFMGVGIIEEFFKWLIVRFACYNSKHFDESFDAIVYAVFVSLGFAAIENLMYVFTSVLSGFASTVLTIIARFVTAVPEHCFLGIIMGFFFAKAKKAQVQEKIIEEGIYILLGLFVPTILHTLYDYFLMASRLDLLVLWFLLAVTSLVVGIIVVKVSSKNNMVLVNRNNDNNW